MSNIGVLFLAGLATVSEATYSGRVWTYQSTSRVDAMGMGYGVAYSMIGRGRHDYATGKQDIYKTTDAAGDDLALPATVWIGSCVYETDELGHLRCVPRKTPIYNIDSNRPICTNNADSEILDPANPDEDTYCENQYEHLYKAPYDPDPLLLHDYNGDKYGAVLSMAGDLELGRLLAVGAPKTFTADADPFVPPNTFYESYGAVYTYTGEYKHWTENQKLTADDSNVVLTQNIPDFGTRVAIDRVTSRTMMVTCPQCVMTERSEGSVYVYKTENGKLWSNTQQLICDDATTDTWEFSKNMRLYDDFALISAVGADELGASYIFREERHSTYKGGVYNGLWTQQQRLHPTDSYIRSSGNLYGEKMDLHGKTLVITQNRQKTYGENSGVAYVYESHKTMEYIDADWIDSEGPHSKQKQKPIHKWWSQVQVLHPADPHAFRLFGDEVSIWGDVIAIMGGGDGLVEAADWSANIDTYQYGSVYMFSRSRSNVDVWTQQQKLYNPDTDDGVYFHTNVDVDYQDWNISIKHNRFGLPRLHGTTMIITDSSQIGYMLTDTVNWKCLLITVGDGMGDGWDRARLVATAPTDPHTREVKHDTYSQYCDAYKYGKTTQTQPRTRNLLEMYRYCPLSAEDEGDYIFEILGNPRGQKGDKGTPTDDLYWREIYWDIYNEFDQKRYIGTAHTKLTFNWGKDDFFFTIKETERLWKPDPVCTQCNVWKGLQKEGQNQPKPKPSREIESIGRRLNLYPTPVPTFTQVPTMRWDQHSSTDQWTFFMGRNDTVSKTDFGSTTSWNEKSQNGTGTHFYIYDSNGLNITEPLIWGQLCTLTGTILDSCTTQDLPVGGTYTLRVTGGTDYRRNEIGWRFCNRVGYAMESLVFTKYSSTCLPIAHYSSQDVCEKNGFTVHTTSLQVLKGMYGLYSEERDTAIVKSALKTMLHPYVVSSITLVVEEEVLHSSTSEDVILRAEVVFDSAANGIDVHELDGLHNFEVALIEKLGYYDDNHLIASLLNTAAHDLLGYDTPTIMSGTDFESHFSSVQIISAIPKKMKLFHDRVRTHRLVDDSLDMEIDTEVFQMDHATQVEYNILNAEAIAGYVVMVCVAVAAVLVTWRRAVKKTRQQSHLTTALDEGEHLIANKEWKESKKKGGIPHV